MIDKEEVRHIAKLARLSLEERELESQTTQLSRVLDFFGDLQRLDTEGVPMTAHPLPMSNVLREDALGSSLPNEEALANAPRSEGPYFRVPRILEG